MTPKPSKRKVVASSSKGTKGARMGKEAQAHMEDATMPPPPRRDSLDSKFHRMAEKLFTFGLDFVFNDPENIILIWLGSFWIVGSQSRERESILGFCLDDLEVGEYGHDYEGCFKESESEEGVESLARIDKSFDDDNPTDDEQAHVDSNLESDIDEGEDFEMAEVSYAPIDDE
ncbi:hypothetical protein HAX54_030195 [Datura stramonium]|uniref:Uncharacterized protein n=1 Tax=Datura stramonium TaxID=4076 RepID=A0ABS8VAD4_DATST|nr:hypothetical protein [Datura stramonium]